MQTATKKIESSSDHVFIGRQPIFDKTLNVCAYELLFRTSEANFANIACPTTATAQLIQNALLEVGLDDLVGSVPAYINFNQDFLTGDLMQLLPKERVVLEILEDVKVDKDVVSAVSELKDLGYTIALDDFVYDPSWEPLIPLAKIIKLDLMATPVDELSRYVEMLRPHGVELLAEKVETQEEFLALKELGFDYFQGYFFCKPAVISRPRLPETHIGTLQLLSDLQNPAVAFDEIESLLSRDVSLSYKLLRYINSAHFALPRKITSIQEAATYLGLDALRTWASLLIMAGASDKPAELILAGLTRAKICELLAEKSGNSDPAAYFIVGLFSILEALLDHPMQEVLQQLPLSEEISAALIDREGEMGEALSCSLAFEAGSISAITFADLPPEIIHRLCLEALIWSSQVIESVE